jgi:hypothetical protein
VFGVISLRRECVAGVKITSEADMNYGYSEILEGVRNTEKYKKWKDAIVSRDKKCVMCGRFGNHVHHIRELKNIIKSKKCRTVDEALKIEDVFDTKNGILVCKKCHSDIHKQKQIVLNGRFYSEVVQCRHRYYDAKTTDGNHSFKYCIDCGFTSKNK